MEDPTKSKMKTTKEKLSKIKDLAGEYAEDSNVAGLKQIFQASTLVARVIWSLLFIICLMGFVYQVYDRVVYFITWPVSVNIEVTINETVVFPAITFCNTNSFRITRAEKIGLFHNLTAFYEHGVTNGSGPVLVYPSMLALMKQLAHSKWDMIYSCRWLDSKCSAENFTEIITDYGLCYSFNMVKDPRLKRNVSGTGSKYGLELVLNIEQYEYMAGPHDSAGVRMLVHDQHEIPRVKDLASSVPSSMNAFVGVQVTQVRNLPPPFGPCADKKLDHHDFYSQSLCQDFCIGRKVADICGCRAPHMDWQNGNGTKQLPVCSVMGYYACVKPIIDQSGRWKNCSNIRTCPIKCLQTAYTADVSYTASSDAELHKKVKILKRNHNLIRKFVNAQVTRHRIVPEYYLEDQAAIRVLFNRSNQVMQLFGQSAKESLVLKGIDGLNSTLATALLPKMYDDLGTLSKALEVLRNNYEDRLNIEALNFYLNGMSFNVKSRSIVRYTNLTTVGLFYQIKIHGQFRRRRRRRSARPRRRRSGRDRYRKRRRRDTSRYKRGPNRWRNGKRYRRRRRSVNTTMTIHNPWRRARRKNVINPWIPVSSQRGNNRNLNSRRRKKKRHRNKPSDGDIGSGGLGSGGGGSGPVGSGGGLNTPWSPDEVGALEGMDLDEVDFDAFRNLARRHMYKRFDFRGRRKRALRRRQPRKRVRNKLAALSRAFNDYKLPLVMVEEILRDAITLYNITNNVNLATLKNSQFRDLPLEQMKKKGKEVIKELEKFLNVISSFQDNITEFEEQITNATMRFWTRDKSISMPKLEQVQKVLAYIGDFLPKLRGRGVSRILQSVCDELDLAILQVKDTKHVLDRYKAIISRGLRKLELDINNGRPRFRELHKIAGTYHSALRNWSNFSKENLFFLLESNQSVAMDVFKKYGSDILDGLKSIRQELIEFEKDALSKINLVKQSKLSMTYASNSNNLMKRLEERLKHLTNAIQTVEKLIMLFDERFEGFNEALLDLRGEAKQFKDSLEINDRFVRRNFMKVNVFYQRLSYQEITKQEAYQWFALVCDIGGSAGLLLGASLLTVAEFVYFLINQCQTAKSKNDQVEPVVPIAIHPEPVVKPKKDRWDEVMDAW